MRIIVASVSSRADVDVEKMGSVVSEVWKAKAKAVGDGDGKEV